jgi:(p)ppGpp synthase/HD superfamily hydrolase
MAVASLALEDGADESVAIAALLHDVVEDTDVTVEDVESRFGSQVARIVQACSDTEETPKPPWRDRKEAYLAHLEALDPITDADTLIVSLADKLHNAQSILADLAIEGDRLWDRFNQGRESQLWYYSALAGVFARKRPGRNSSALQLVVDELRSTAQSN